MRNTLTAVIVTLFLLGGGCQRELAPTPTVTRSDKTGLGKPLDNPQARDKSLPSSKSVAGETSEAISPQATPDDPLLVLNAGFRAIYQRVRGEQIAGARPIVVALGDQLTLLEQEGQKEGSDLSPQYHALKTIAHVPLAIDVCFIGCAPGPLDEARRQELMHFCVLIDRTREALSSCGFSKTQLDRQNAILAAALDYAQPLQAGGHYLPEERIEFCRKLRPWLMTNAEEAARLRIDAYHATMSEWRQTMSDEEWARLKVLILGAALPRKDNLAVQYFAKLLGEPGESRRVIYAESIFTLDPALDLLGTYVLDRRISLDFFDDPQRMQRDLLSDAAYEYLKSREWELQPH